MTNVLSRLLVSAFLALLIIILRTVVWVETGVGGGFVQARVYQVIPDWLERIDIFLSAALTEALHTFATYSIPFLLVLGTCGVLGRKAAVRWIWRGGFAFVLFVGMHAVLIALRVPRSIAAGFLLGLAQPVIDGSMHSWPRTQVVAEQVVMALAWVMPLLTLAIYLAHPSKQPIAGACWSCGYDLLSLEGHVCPECGSSVPGPSSARTTPRASRSSARTKRGT